MNYFLTSRKPSLIYRLYLNSFKKNFDKKNSLSTKFLLIKNEKIPDLDYLIFLIYLIFSGKIFQKSIRSSIHFKNVKIGNHVLSRTYRNFKSYSSKFYFYYFMIKNFYLAGCIFRTSKNYLKNYNFKGVYLDHLMYLNGIYYQIFAKNRKIIYSNVYPKSAFKIDFTKNKKKYFDFSKSITIEYLKKKLKRQEKTKVENFKKNYLKQSYKYIPWMIDTKYKTLDNFLKLRLWKYQYIIFPHSFTDAQMSRGFDGFETTYDWLIFTLDYLKKNNKKAIIKGHPNYYKKSRGIFSDWDKKIFNKVKRIYEKNENFYFIDKSINNMDILKRLNKNCIGLTHHGTVILEMSLLKYKTISSSKCPWESKYKISNKWSSKSEYRNILQKSWKKLKFSDQNDINKICHELYFNQYNFHGEYSVHSIMKKTLKKSYSRLKDNPKIFSTDAISKNLTRQEKVFNKNFPLKKQKEFIDIFSNNIIEI